MQYTTGDAVNFNGEKWYVSKVDWVYKPYDNDPNYCQRVALVQFDNMEDMNMTNAASGFRNTDIDGLWEDEVNK
jgi:hypothetical protein